MIKIFNIAKNNNLLSIKNLKYLTITSYLQNSIIGMESNNQKTKDDINKKTTSNIIINQSTINESKQLTENEIFKNNIDILIGKNKDYLKNLDKLKNLKSEDYEKEKKTNVEFSDIFECLSISEFNKVMHSGKLSTVCKCNIKKGNNIIKNHFDVDMCYKFVIKDCFEREIIPTFKWIIPRETKGYNNVIDIKTKISNKYLDLIITPFYRFKDLNTFNYHARKLNYIKNFKISTLVYFKQIIDGYGLLYNNNIFHSDIKPENIFVTGSCYFSIADFSVSEKYNKNKTLKLYDNGTKIYMPKEQLLELEIDGTDVNKVDMYSLGCTLYITLFNKNWVNFDKVKKNNKEYVDIIDKTDLIINNIDKTTEDLIRKLLAKDYKERAGYLDIINSDIYKLTEKFDEIHKYWIKNNKYIKDKKEKECFLTYLENNKDFIKYFEEELEKCKPIEINSNNFVIFGDVLNNNINNINENK